MATEKAKSARQMARSIPHPVTDSTLAHLGEHASTASATASNPDALRTGTATNFSGQYLYDRLITADREEVTKMGLVRMMVSQLDLNSFKNCMTDFVNVAKGYLDNAIKADTAYDKDHPSAVIADLSAKVKTAQNHQSVLRLAYGALKFVPDALTANGYDAEKTGYQTMRVIAKKALDDAGMNWDGSKVPSKADRAKKQVNAVTNKAFELVAADNPQQDGESRLAWLTRIDPMIEIKTAEVRSEMEQEQRTKLVKKVRELCGPLLDDVLHDIAEGDKPSLDPQAAQQAAPAATKH